MNPYLECTRPNFWLSCMLIDENSKVKPMDIINMLNDANVEARPIWKPMHLQPVFKKNDFISVTDKSVGEKIFEHGICLPSDIKMTEAEQNIVIDLIKNMF